MVSASEWTVELLFVLLVLCGGLGRAENHVNHRVHVSRHGFQPPVILVRPNDLITFDMRESMVNANWSIAEANLASLESGCLQLKGISDDDTFWDCYQSNCTTTKTVRSRTFIVYGIHSNNHSECSHENLSLFVDVYHDYYHFNDGSELHTYKEYYDAVPPPQDTRRRYSNINNRFNNYHGHNNNHSGRSIVGESDNGHAFKNGDCYDRSFVNDNYCGRIFNSDNHYEHGFNNAINYKAVEFMVDVIRKNDEQRTSNRYCPFGLGIATLFLYFFLLLKIRQMQRQFDKAQEVIERLVVMQNEVPALFKMEQQPVADTKLVILDA